MKERYDELFERSKDDHAMIVGSEVREVIQELRHLRARVFLCRQVEGADHSTACTIWGDDGQGNIDEREPHSVSLPCNCGALLNWEKQEHKARVSPDQIDKRYATFFGFIADAAQRYCEGLERVEAEAYAYSRPVHEPKFKAFLDDVLKPRESRGH